jgi:hypothetical protein
MPTQTIVFSKSTVLTNNQIKALPTTSIELVPAAGAGQVIIPLQLYIAPNISVAYSNINSDAYCSFLQNTRRLLEDIPNDSGNGLAYVNDLLGENNNLWVVHAALGYPIAALNNNWASFVTSINNVAAFANQPLQMVISNSDSGDFTGGDASNTIKVIVNYTVIDIS